MIRTRSGKRQSQSDVYTLVEGVEFQRNQALVVVHAEHSIKLTLDDPVEKRVGWVRPGNLGRSVQQATK